jgi:hypothetical protein
MLQDSFTTLVIGATGRASGSKMKASATRLRANPCRNGVKAANVAGPFLWQLMAVRRIVFWKFESSQLSHAVGDLWSLCDPHSLSMRVAPMNSRPAAGSADICGAAIGLTSVVATITNVTSERHCDGTL